MRCFSSHTNTHMFAYTVRIHECVELLCCRVLHSVRCDATRICLEFHVCARAWRPYVRACDRAHKVPGMCVCVSEVIHSMRMRAGHSISSTGHVRIQIEHRPCNARKLVAVHTKPIRKCLCTKRPSNIHTTATPFGTSLHT